MSLFTASCPEVLPPSPPNWRYFLYEEDDQHRGYLELLKKPKYWCVYFVIFRGSTCYLYKSACVPEPKTVFELRGGAVVHTTAVPKKKSILKIFDASGNLLASFRHPDVRPWLENFSSAFRAWPRKPPVLALPKKKKKPIPHYRPPARRKPTVPRKILLNIAPVISKLEPILESKLQQVSSKPSMDIVFKIFLKIYVIWYDKDLALSVFLDVDQQFRPGLSLLVKIFNNWEFIKADPARALRGFAKVSEHFREASSLLIKQVLPWVTTKNMNRLTSLSEIFTDPQFYFDTFYDEGKTEPLACLMNYADFYLNFIKT
jgi:hypothetical protein